MTGIEMQVIHLTIEWFRDNGYGDVKACDFLDYVTRNIKRPDDKDDNAK